MLWLRGLVQTIMIKGIGDRDNLNKIWMRKEQIDSFGKIALVSTMDPLLIDNYVVRPKGDYFYQKNN